MIRRTDLNSDQNCRSLLQKAVRRGASGVTKLAVIRLIDNHEISWLKKRLPVIAFEESWGATLELDFSSNEENLLSQYLKLATSSKNKDAAGLGSLGYELSNGNSSVLRQGDPQNRKIKLIAEAVKRPTDFWRWIETAATDEKIKILLNNAETGYKLAGWPWDKAFAIATAYLALTEGIPNIITHDADDNLDFPYWVAIDKHTTAGKRALIKLSSDAGLNKDSLGWIQFYLESAKCANLSQSYWWSREAEWRLNCEGLTLLQAEKIWSNASEQIKQTVSKIESKLISDLQTSLIKHEATINKQNKLL